MTRATVLALTVLISACQVDETVTGYGAAGKTWHLIELNGAPFAATATLQFPERGKIVGEGPCNRFSAAIPVPYPWFEMGPIQSTKLDCAERDAETAFFDALVSMSQSEVLGDVMILRTENEEEMVFKASG